jgi:hypothetical protein
MTLTTGTIEQRLDEIDQDLARRVDLLEAAARDWFMAKRTREHAHAVAFITAKQDGLTVAESEAMADRESCMIGQEAEAEFEAIRAVVRVLETRATIGASLLKAYGRAGG